MLETTLVNRINKKITSIKNTFLVNRVNTLLIEENRNLRLRLLNSEAICKINANKVDNYKLLTATVINNSIIYYKNFITIDKGARDGIEPGMGVFCSTGIVGKVNRVSENFSVISSILHMDLWTSAEIKNTGVIGSIRWLGKNCLRVKLMYIPIHARINLGDEIITSGYGNTYPRGIPIGKVSNIEIRQGEAFYNVDLDLCTDLSSLQGVYIVKDKRSLERIELENLQLTAA